MFRTKFKYGKYEQRAITQKLARAELWFLSTAHLLNEIYPPMKFEVDSSNSLGVILWARKRDGRTDKAATICSPFEEHKNCNVGQWKTFISNFSIMLTYKLKVVFIFDNIHTTQKMIPKIVMTTKSKSKVVQDCLNLRFRKSQNQK